MKLEEIFAQDPAQAVAELKRNKNVIVPPIEKMREEYIPTKHKVCDPMYRPDKKLKNNKTEPVSRIFLGLQELATKRMTEFMFAIPVRRVYHGRDKSDTHKAVAKAIESVYNTNHIDGVNIERGRSLFSSCETATLWYLADKKDNNVYGFKTNKVLKCKNYDPMESYKLYPYFDEYDDLVAMSVETHRMRDENNIDKYFDTWTADEHWRWNITNGTTLEEGFPVKNENGKIPLAYANRRTPIWEYGTPIIDEIELSLSRNSDVIAYNASPILTITGNLVGNEDKGDSRRIFKLSEGGSVNYVSWSQANESVRYHVDTMLKLLWLQLQLPDISLENLRGLNASGEAMKTLLTDAHLKVGDEKHKFIEYFEREANVIKSFMKQLNPSWATAIDEIEIEHIITPFIQKDEEAEIRNINNLTGGKPLMSQREGIELLGWTRDVDNTIKLIDEEDIKANANKVSAILSNAREAE